ncbi:MAG: hypothetical protein M0P12_07930 [Paludibacteraceae bacterium]|nr:hypothetical protein [Paludibacteraceae bacterium]
MFKQNEKILEYSECVTENGIYRYCADSMYKSHSFNEVEYIENCLPLNPPFLNKKVVLFEKKSYEINTKKVEIISYEELNSVHDEIVTYYIKGLGFICYCDLEKMSCLILSDYKGISFDKGLYSEIKDRFINDTLYFALERIKRFQPPSPPK